METHYYSYHHRVGCEVKRILTVLLLLTYANAAQSEIWLNQYLADTGGAHLIVVPKEERQTTEAYIHGDGIRLSIGCYKDTQQNIDRRYYYAQVGNGNPFAGGEMILVANFDQLYEYRLGEFGYAGGSYHGKIGLQILVMLATSKTVTFTDLMSDFKIEFVLQGAIEAIMEIECMGDIK